MGWFSEEAARILLGPFCGRPRIFCDEVNLKGARGERGKAILCSAVLSSNIMQSIYLALDDVARIQANVGFFYPVLLASVSTQVVC